ncbi:MAG: hydroxymethylglutaryl-CoA lyase [Deltaproteobacteria bacterium HGW-Deltaproteobacteria-10]|nr:MAG: hydroxymethylglutaryl-CoA lyase [Deltaproteobacteria bacterium HGW-Deltaproteobacteria-10]
MEKVKIIEVGPRDGLQNIDLFVPTNKKIQFIKRLADCGIKEIQIGSFVDPQAIPQFQDIQKMVKGLNTLQDIVLSALIPNIRGAENAASCGIGKFIFFFSVSHSHNCCNVRQTPQESIEVLKRICQTYLCDPAITIQVALATAFGCPFEGSIKTGDVLRAVDKAVSCGVKEITLCDTVGFGNPQEVEEKFSACRKRFPEITFGAHFHNTRGLALANTLRAYETGIRCFDAAAGGLGGCPYAPNSSGNAATEETVFLFEEMGIKTGIDLKKLLDVCRFLQKTIPQAKITSSLLQAGLPEKHHYAADNNNKKRRIKCSTAMKQY